MNSDPVTRSLARLSVETPSDALKFVRFALRVLRDTPLGNGFTPAELLTDHPALVEGLDAVGRFLEGDGWPDGDRRWRAVIRAADEVGPFGQDVTGKPAAAWAVFQLVTAVETFTFSPLDREALDDAAAHATLAAELAVRSAGNGYAPEAVRFVAAMATAVLGVRAG